MTARRPTATSMPRGNSARQGVVRPVSAVRSAMRQGFVLGREVLIGKIPGMVVAYNIARFGGFVGAIYPIVVRTALGVAKCKPDELELA